MITFFSIVARNPEFVDLQDRSIRKHCLHDYRYRVVVNEPDRNLREKIVAHCVALGVVYEVFPATYSNPSVSHAEAIQHVWDHSDGGRIAIIDMDICPVYSWTWPSDMFPLMGVRQIRDMDYLWPGFLLADLSQLPDKDQAKFGVVLGVRDTGGQFGDYLKDHPSTYLWLSQQERDGFEFINQSWLHCGNGSNWKEKYSIDETARIAEYRRIVEANL